MTKDDLQIKDKLSGREGKAYGLLHNCTTAFISCERTVRS